MKKFWTLCLLLCMALCLLAACAGNPTETTEPVNVEEQIWWNPDRLLYGQLRHRTPDPETGIYTVRLLGDGEMVTFETTRSEVVEYMSKEYTFGLNMDEEGRIYGTRKLRDFVANVAVDGRAVASVEDGIVKLQGKGEPSEITLSEKTKIYDVTGWTAAIGTACQLAPGDMIYALKDFSGQIIRVYVMDRPRSHDDSHSCDCCGQAVTWTAWDTAAELQDGGHYYLTGNVNLNKAVALEGKTVTLCLNGYTMKSKECAWVISGGGHLKITDHKNFEGNELGMLTGSGYEVDKPTYEAMEGGTIRVTDETSGLSLYGGNLTVKIPEGDKYQVKRGGVIDNHGTVDLYGGAVIGGTATSYAGNIQSRGVLNVHQGGLITAGESEYAGNVLVVSGELNLYDGGVISDGSASMEGGNLQVNGNGTFNMYGGLVTGGGFKGKTREGTLRGGNLMTYGTINMYGGVMSYGKASQYGGNICTWISPTINLLQDEKSTTVPQITSGIAPYAGNVILRGTEPQLNVSYGKITDGRVETYGGGVCFTAGGVHLSGTAQITGNGIDDLYIGEGLLVTAEDLQEGASIGITMMMPGKFMDTEEDLRSFFTCNEGFEVHFDGLEMLLRQSN